MRRPFPAAILGVLMVSLAACSSTTAGTATPTTSPTSAPSQAPKVAYPLDASAFLAKPCSVLTPTDTTALGLPDAHTSDNSDKLGPGCVFSAGGASIGIDWEVVDTNGLSAIYQLMSKQAYWIPMPIEGYPAVEADSSDSRASLGECVVNVGVNDRLFFIASSDGAKGADAACLMAEHAAGAVVRNLKAAQGGR